MPLKSHCAELLTTLEVEREKQDELQTAPPSWMASTWHVFTFRRFGMCGRQSLWGSLSLEAPPLFPLPPWDTSLGRCPWAEGSLRTPIHSGEPERGPVFWVGQTWAECDGGPGSSPVARRPGPGSASPPRPAPPAHLLVLILSTCRSRTVRFPCHSTETKLCV